MEAYKACELLSKHGKCINCGSEVVGEDRGNIIIEDDVFIRSCSCGCTVTIDLSKQKRKEI